LLRAKRAGWCDEIRPLIDRLQSELNFFLSAEIRRRVLEQAGEPDAPQP
jgi:predicted nucleic acid-binding protein